MPPPPHSLAGTHSMPGMRILAGLALLLMTAGTAWAVPDASSRRVYAISGVRLVYKPHTMAHGAHGEFEHLRWKHWSSATAGARGRLDYADAYEHFTAPVRVTLSRIGTCGHRRAYRRETVRAVRASDRTRLRALTGTFDLVCPLP